MMNPIESNWDDLARELGLPPDKSGAPLPMAEAVEDDEPPMAELVDDEDEFVEPIHAAEVSYQDDLDDEPEDEPAPPPRRKVTPVEPVLRIPKEPLPWPSDDLEEAEITARPARVQRVEHVEIPEVEESSESEEDDDEEGSTEEGGETTGDDGGKKRRRRRRRRKKGAAGPKDAVAEDAKPAPVTSKPTPVVSKPVPVPVAVAEEESLDTELDEDEVEDEVLYEGGQDEEEEDAVAMEILETWNVPTWQELIASLYRPER